MKLYKNIFMSILLLVIGAIIGNLWRSDQATQFVIVLIAIFTIVIITIYNDKKDK